MQPGAAHGDRFAGPARCSADHASGTNFFSGLATPISIRNIVVAPDAVTRGLRIHGTRQGAALERRLDSYVRPRKA